MAARLGLCALVSNLHFSMCMCAARLLAASYAYAPRIHMHPIHICNVRLGSNNAALVAVNTGLVPCSLLRIPFMLPGRSGSVKSLGKKNCA